MFANNITLCKLIFRRDRLRILLWFSGIALLVFGFGAALPNMWEKEALPEMYTMMENPAMVVMLGPAYTLADGSVNHGTMYALFMLVWSIAGLGVMNVFHVVRHTRQDEENGRIEVIRSLPTGRLANLSATLSTAAIINAVFALLLGLGLGAIGLEGMDFGASMLFGILLGTGGMVFAAVTAIFCQMSQNPRTAMSWSFAFIVIAYFLRAVGDMQESAVISALSPLGLPMLSKVCADNNWLPVLGLLLMTVVATTLAFWLCSIRDMGEGLIAARPGKRDAVAYMKSPGGLAWRLLKTPFIVWAIVVMILAMAYASVMGDVDAFLTSNEALMAMTGGDPLVMVGFFIVVMSIAATIPVLQLILKARSEEKRGYAENVIARSASRNNQLRGYFTLAAIAAILMPLLNAVGFWAGSSAVMDEPVDFLTMLAACIVYMPTMFFMIGVAVLLIGWLPKFTSIAWWYLGYAFLAIYLGGLMQLGDGLNYLTPFGYVPMLTAGRVVEDEAGTIIEITKPGFAAISGADVTAIIVTTALAVIMCVFGFIGYRRRDMKFS